MMETVCTWVGIMALVCVALAAIGAGVDSIAKARMARREEHAARWCVTLCLHVDQYCGHDAKVSATARFIAMKLAESNKIAIPAWREHKGERNRWSSGGSLDYSMFCEDVCESPTLWKKTADLEDRADGLEALVEAARATIAMASEQGVKHTPEFESLLFEYGKRYRDAEEAGWLNAKKDGITH